MKKIDVRNKEISWLSFNERLLQEASNANVPLIERLNFLGIYSNNLDEFFRVRVAILRRLAMMGKTTLVEGDDPRVVIDRIETIVVQQGKKFEQIYQKLLLDLAKENIFLLNENELTKQQGSFVKEYFSKKVRPLIMPVILRRPLPLPTLNDDSIYMAVSMCSELKSRYALIEVPTAKLSRFVIIPSDDDRTNIILLEDIIRYELRDIFYMFQFDTIDSYIVKITRDAELDINDDVAESYVKAVSKSLERRGQSEPVRFIYDKTMPENFLKILLKKLNFDKNDTVIGGSRIHNFKDFMSFPKVGGKHLIYPPLPAINHTELEAGKTYLSNIAERDLLFHFPYQSFTHFMDLLREASIDPKVTQIQITIYRVASSSSVMNALINAARNGKKVTVVLELRARFNEKDNIRWGNELRKENVKVIFGVPGLKVHSKLCLITHKENGQSKQFACIGTGNFNEDTAKVFGDHLLCTANEKLTNEVDQIFRFFDRNYQIGKFDNLLVSPFTMRKKLTRFINHEIACAKAGKEAFIYIKCNNLVDSVMIAKLHEAARAGVDVRLNVRGMFSLLPTPRSEEYTIPAIGLIDRFLEHSRVYWFSNSGEDRLYISSADLMTRNLDRRVEVAVPILEPKLQEEVKTMMRLQWEDNKSARILNNLLDNEMRGNNKQKSLRAQLQFYRYLSSDKS